MTILNHSKQWVIFQENAGAHQTPVLYFAPADEKGPSKTFLAVDYFVKTVLSSALRSSPLRDFLEIEREKQ